MTNARRRWRKSSGWGRGWNDFRFLDTNVLMGITETDLLLSLSETGGVFRPYWSDYVFDELREHLHEHIQDGNAEGKALKRIDAKRVP